MFSLPKVLAIAFFCFCNFVTAHQRQCKALPGSHDWPEIHAWDGLNSTLAGQLIKPVPPGAVCHPGQATYNETDCTAVKLAWSTYPFHASDPVSSAWSNDNNDTCVQDAQYSCNGKGYPQYVVNATSAADVKIGVDFARKHNIRLIVKATGHDYLGRSSAPNSLSIWTKHLTGIQFFDTFKPKGCNSTSYQNVVKAAAGSNMEDLYVAASHRNLTVIGGMAKDVSIGGYITGGGHSELSATHGLAADNVLEIEIVTPSGEILVANECQNEEYFYAFRGGGGSTFGLLISATMKTFPSPPFAQILLQVQAPTASEAWWEQMAYILSQYHYLSDHSVVGYPSIVPAAGNNSAAVYTGPFVILDGTNVTGLAKIFDPIITHLSTAWPGASKVTNITLGFPDFLSQFEFNYDKSPAGLDQVMSSRLLDVDTLTRNVTELKEALKAFTGTTSSTGSRAHLVSGKGLWNAVPAGGKNAVNPAWRKAQAHLTIRLYWDPQNQTEKAEKLAQVQRQTQYLRDLNPNSGAYINEANPNEPNWQFAFWGKNYPILSAIKKRVDPTDVFWCHPCVGSEGWEVVGNSLCKV